MLLKLIAVFVAFPTVFGAANCPFFNSNLAAAKAIVDARADYEANLQLNGGVLAVGDPGFVTIRFPPKPLSHYEEIKNASYFTQTAQLIAAYNPSLLNSFEHNAICLDRTYASLSSHSKYRSISGFGNNLKHPFWGNSGTPVARFGPKNYADGVYALRKSVKGGSLPSARKISLNLLRKAEKGKRPKQQWSNLELMRLFYLTHDTAMIAPTESTNRDKFIKCCQTGGTGFLSPLELNHECAPVDVAPDDPTYKVGNVICMHFLRSGITTAPDGLNAGEIRNRATSFFDHSVFYGDDDIQANSQRTYAGGKLKMDRAGIFPVDGRGVFAESSLRLIFVPIAGLFGVFYSRNHNKLADNLALLNPQWDDETLFQEARRINIAIYQNHIYSSELLKLILGETINENYNPSVDPATTSSFQTTANRFGHFYIPDDIEFINATGYKWSLLNSDTFGTMALMQNNLDDLVRGMFRQPLNYEYGDDILSRFTKNPQGLGLDVIASDIQRGRDHGLPTWLQIRKECKLKHNFEDFEDLEDILPKANVKLLKQTYASVKDIDLNVGASLETFRSLDKFFGETFSCIFRHQYKKLMAGDAYFYSHKNSPYPFTTQQLTAIKNYQNANLICQNSNVESIPREYQYVVSEANPLVPCSNYGFIDLSAWKE